MKTRKNNNPPPATTTVHRALLTEPPIIFGCRLWPVTVAHVIALEALESPLVLFHRRVSFADILEAFCVLRRPGKALLQLGGGEDEEVLTPAKAKAEAMQLSLTLSPAQMKDAAEAVQTWLFGAYETHVPGKSEGGDPLPARPDEPKGSAGQSN